MCSSSAQSAVSSAGVGSRRHVGEPHMHPDVVIHSQLSEPLPPCPVQQPDLVDPQPGDQTNIIPPTASSTPSTKLNGSRAWERRCAPGGLRIVGNRDVASGSVAHGCAACVQQRFENVFPVERVPLSGALVFEERRPAALAGHVHRSGRRERVEPALRALLRCRLRRKGTRRSGIRLGTVRRRVARDT